MEATGAGGDGSFFPEGSPSTMVKAARERTRPFTHQRSPTTMLGAMDPDTPPARSEGPNPGAWNWIARLWNGNDLGTPAQMACRVENSMASPIEGEPATFEICRVGG